LLVIELRSLDGGKLQRPEEVVAGRRFAVFDFLLGEEAGSVVISRLELGVEDGKVAFGGVTPGQIRADKQNKNRRRNPGNGERSCHFFSVPVSV
jgi:hypothetical protein